MGKRKSKNPNRNDKETLNTQSELTAEIVNSSEITSPKQKKMCIPLENSKKIDIMSGSTEEKNYALKNKSSKKKNKKHDRETQYNIDINNCFESQDTLSKRSNVSHKEFNRNSNIKPEKKIKKKKTISEDEFLGNSNDNSNLPDSAEEKVSDTVQKKTSKKKRKTQFEIQTTRVDNVSAIEDENKPRTEVRKKFDELQSLKFNSDGKQNKKIVFDDDTGEPQDSTDTVSSINNLQGNIKRRKHDKYLQEEEPDDADIDQFCDDIDEEDNMQYENWIQLIEAKLGSNKNKP